MFTLNVVLPSGLYLTESVDSITLPTIDGQRTLLPNHMATVLPIETGVMYLKHQGQISVSKQKKLVEKGRTCSFSIVEEEKTGNFQLNTYRNFNSCEKLLS